VTFNAYKHAQHVCHNYMLRQEILDDADIRPRRRKKFAGMSKSEKAAFNRRKIDRMPFVEQKKYLKQQARQREAKRVKLAQKMAEYRCERFLRMTQQQRYDELLSEAKQNPRERLCTLAREKMLKKFLKENVAEKRKKLTRNT